MEVCGFGSSQEFLGHWTGKRWNGGLPRTSWPLPPQVFCYPTHSLNGPIFLATRPSYSIFPCASPRPSSPHASFYNNSSFSHLPTMGTNRGLYFLMMFRHNDHQCTPFRVTKVILDWLTCFSCADRDCHHLPQLGVLSFSPET